VDAFFCGSHIGHYSDPAAAARVIGAGDYNLPTTFSDNARPQNIPPEISKWQFIK
jgi:hypothetical protein